MPLDHKKYNDLFLQNAQAGHPPINDAEAYGVRLVPAAVAEGQTYWKIIGIHHLLPEENIGNHHIYLEALDESGNRARNPHAWAGWTWEGKRPDERADPVALDKPDYETAGNIAVHFGQIISVWIKGLSPDANDITDHAENLHTNHPDEPAPDGSLWNSIGHHSFYVVFQRTRTISVANDSVISGYVERGQGLTVWLLQNNRVIAEQLLDSSQRFRFDSLAYGTYAIEVANTGIQVENNTLNAENKQVELALEVPPPANSAIFGVVTNGAGKQLQLLKAGTIVGQITIPASNQYRFEELEAGVYSLQVINTDVRQDNIVLDGTNTRQVNLEVPEIETPGGKPIAHYILIGPAGTRGRKVNLQLTNDFALFFSLTVGYNVAEAKRARLVTIIGEGISKEDQNAIEQSGSQLEVLAGDAYDIEAELRRRIQTGHAFPDDDSAGPFNATNT